MPLYIYGCAADHFKEAFRSISSRDDTTICETCGQMATRQITTVGFKLEPFTGDFPDAAAKWERLHAEKLAWEIKHERQHDDLPMK